MANPLFRGLLLIGAGIPILLLYAWSAVLQPILVPGSLGDFRDSYMRAAARLAAGLDPYDLCQTLGCLEPTGPQYVTPPPLAWLLQPVVQVDSHVLAFGVVVLLNASLAAFLLCMLRALRVDDWQLGALLVLAAVAFDNALARIGSH